MRAPLGFLIAAVAVFASSSAFADEGQPAAAPPPGAATALPSAPPVVDGGRFRFGINAAAGNESVSASSGGASASGTMYGLDLRLGWQINNLLAIYAQPHMSFGSLTAKGGNVTVSGATGTIVSTVMAEATFADRFFVGAGLGYGILNNPSGLALGVRAGGYPLMSHADDGPRRRGLMLGVDVKTVFVDGATGVLALGCIGYEKF